MGVLLWLAIERPISWHWAGHFSPPLHKWAYNMLFSPCTGSNSGTIGSVQTVHAFVG